MSQSSPPPSSHGAAAGVPPAGGNGKYIALALLLFLLMGGGLYWKFGGSPPPPPKPPPLAQTSPTSTDSKIDDVPPPPPVEVVPEAGAAKTIVRVIDPCGSKACAGASTPELEAALSVRAKQARRCYENELKTDPNLKGRIQMTVRVGGNGAICGVNVASTELPTVSPCVERVFRNTGGFPAPKGGCVEASVPISFVPGR